MSASGGLPTPGKHFGQESPAAAHSRRAGDSPFLKVARELARIVAAQTALDFSKVGGTFHIALALMLFIAVEPAANLFDEIRKHDRLQWVRGEPLR
jgi:hypothetical protein